MGIISNWRWRMECRKAFKKAAQNVKASVFGACGFFTLAVGPHLGEVKEKLFNKALWEKQSTSILEEEFKRAIKKYIG